MWLVPTRWLYAPLDPSRRQIRLLEILPVWKTDRQTPISARLVIVSLDDEPDYSALSYTWGDGTTTNHIIVDGKRIGCTANLHHALNDLRSNPWDVIKKTPKRIWVDAVCINQEDLEEKNHQLPLMETIYTKAKVVYCWLG
ncbi:HET-domain-containing protein, partial [Sporormia fimetaria CBS 119925]